MPTPEDPADSAPRAARRRLGRGPGTSPGSGAPPAPEAVQEVSETAASEGPPASGTPATVEAPAAPGPPPGDTVPEDAEPAEPDGGQEAAEAADRSRQRREAPEPGPGPLPGQSALPPEETTPPGQEGQPSDAHSSPPEPDAGPEGREHPESRDDDAQAAVRPAPASVQEPYGGPDQAPAGRDGAPADEAPAAAGQGEAAGEAEQQEPDDGRFKVVLDNFEGPFDLLLQLISKHKLDVTEVALSKVTDEFMAHIHAMGTDWDLDQTTEFLVVAATLLDLKAARLLPAAEVEDEADLALLEARDLLFARLLQYRAYKEIAGIFADRMADEAHRYPRTVGLEPHHAELLPEVAISIGPEGFARLAVKAMRPKPKPQVYVEHIHAPLVSVREQAEVVVARLRELGEATFQRLTEDAADTLTVVARFLALLELYRERAVSLDQEEALGALTVRWSGPEDLDPVVTDEFDRGPQEPDGKGASAGGGAPQKSEPGEPSGSRTAAPQAASEQEPGPEPEEEIHA